MTFACTERPKELKKTDARAENMLQFYPLMDRNTREITRDWISKSFDRCTPSPPTPNPTLSQHTRRAGGHVRISNHGEPS